MVRDRIKILSTLPIVGHPRDSKRIAMLKQAGFDVEAVAFSRPYHKGRIPDCPVESLGNIESGRYWSRLFRMAKVLPRVRRAIRRNHMVYASGPDMALLALVAGLWLRKPVVVEIGDIREVQLANGFVGKLVRWLDKRLVDNCALLVVTAPKFLHTYYREWLNSSVRAIVIENKLESKFADQIGPRAQRAAGRACSGKSQHRLRIGYFGGLRCEWSWNVLRELAVARPDDIEIVLAGYPMNPKDLPDRVQEHGNIEYLGEYRSPQDLPSLYARIDLVWACYQHIGPQDWNLRWARPNRFYESCLFGKPLVSRAGSCDATEVERYNIGLVVEDEGVDSVVEKVAQITADDLETWSRNLSALPRSVYVYTTEADTLATEIRAILEAIDPP